MGRTSRGGKRPYLPPVKNVEVGKPNVRKRLIVITILFAIGIVGIGMGIFFSRQWEDGWKIVESDNVLGCASEISFHYYLAGEGAAERSKEVARLYTELCAKEDIAYSLKETGNGNLAYLNAHPNETVEICPELYGTLEKLKKYGCRYLFLGPAYETYEGLFSCSEDRETVDFDPVQNPELADEFRQVAAFAGDPGMVDTELLGGNKVRLKVADPYAAFAKERTLHNFVDLRILKNAAILEDMAAVFAEKGYTDGYMQTADGFGVNLKAGEEFLINVANAGDGIIAQLRAEPPVAFAALRDYALTDSDKWRVYTFADGSVRTIFLDPEDGLPKTAALHDLLLLSKEKGCLELAALGAEIFGKESFVPEKLPEKGLTSVWCEGRILHMRGERVKAAELAGGYTISE